MTNNTENTVNSENLPETFKVSLTQSSLYKLEALLLLWL